MSVDLVQAAAEVFGVDRDASQTCHRDRMTAKASAVGPFDSSPPMSEHHQERSDADHR